MLWAFDAAAAMTAAAGSQGLTRGGAAAHELHPFAAPWALPNTAPSPSARADSASLRPALRAAPSGPEAPVVAAPDSVSVSATPGAASLGRSPRGAVALEDAAVVLSPQWRPLPLALDAPTPMLAGMSRPRTLFRAALLYNDAGMHVRARGAAHWRCP